MFSSLFDNLNTDILNACKTQNIENLKLAIYKILYGCNSKSIKKETLKECFDILLEHNNKEMIMLFLSLSPMYFHVQSTHNSILSDDDLLKYMITNEWSYYVDMIIHNMKIEDMDIIDRIMKIYKEIQERDNYQWYSIISERALVEMYEKGFYNAISKVIHSCSDFEEIQPLIKCIIDKNDVVIFKMILDNITNQSLLNNIVTLVIDKENETLFKECIKHINYSNNKVLAYIAKRNCVALVDIALQSNNEFIVNEITMNQMSRISVRRSHIQILKRLFVYNGEYTFSYNTLTLFKSDFPRHRGIQNTIIKSMKKLTHNQLEKLLFRNQYILKVYLIVVNNFIDRVIAE